MKDAKGITLLPAPRSIELQDDVYKLETGKRIALLGAPAQELLFSALRLRATLQEIGIEWTLAATAIGDANGIGARLLIDSARIKNIEGYELTIAPRGIEIVANSPRGIFYGVCTLNQILQSPILDRRSLPCLHIIDYPDLPARGVMLDISRDKVPTMPTLYDLIDLLASWKINQLQLYTEHTFAYQNHREVWQNASPLTAHEILELDKFCRERFIELVPNQNSFGHMHRWLEHPRYRDLAETPDGCVMWGEPRGPFSLNPLDPRSLALIEELYDELLPNFSSRQFNVGCDETLDLGQGRSKAECERRGTGRVYLDFLLKIYNAVKARGHTMQFWGDIIVQHPELIPELPRDAIALEWGYQADHPFDEDGAQFAQAGIPFYVCPGTSTWNSIAGRTANALGNLCNAAENGLKHGAIGYLNTDWGDNGHWQYLPFSYIGFAYGAAVSWSLATNRNIDIARATSLFAFRDATGTLGQLAYDLGNTDKSLGIDLHNSTVLFRILQWQLDRIPERISGITSDALKQTEHHIAQTVRALRRAKSVRADAKLITAEFESAATILQHACERGQLALETNPRRARALKRKLKLDLAHIVKEYRTLWHARNRPGGFKDSVARFAKLREEYE
jgi:hypothetical protein